MSYQHHFADNSPISLPLGKVVCVGRNYAEHARELNNPVPAEPLLFIKPATAVVALDQPLRLPQGLGAVHYETEIALLIGQTLSGDVSELQASAAIVGIGLALLGTMLLSVSAHTAYSSAAGTRASLRTAHTFPPAAYRRRESPRRKPCGGRCPDAPDRRCRGGRLGGAARRRAARGPERGTRGRLRPAARKGTPSRIWSSPRCRSNERCR